MAELLAPAGDITSFYESIKHGADAVYIGLANQSARAYAENFSIDDIKNLTAYAHSYGVKVYVAMNITFFDSELAFLKETADKLIASDVDAIIACDSALIAYLLEAYPKFPIHLSTQMGIDDIHGLYFWEKHGVKRCVLARELPLDYIKELQSKTQIELEVFIHGALCISYSGNCLMSGLIGLRSGNRGRCVGSCRKNYNLHKNGELISSGYLLSMKDLKTTQLIDHLKTLSSLKIEGRMKEPPYISNVVRQYRQLLDNKTTIANADKNLVKSFNRTFTRGYIGGEDRANVTNTQRPNNFGYPIGKILEKRGSRYRIELKDTLNQHDCIRLTSDDLEVNLPVIKMYNKTDELISTAQNECFIELTERFPLGTVVYKTKDTRFEEMINEEKPRKNAMCITLSINKDQRLSCIASALGYKETFVSPFTLASADTAPLTLELFTKVFSKLHETPFYLDNINMQFGEHFYARMKDLNDFKRSIITNMIDKITYRVPLVKQELSNKKISFLGTNKEIVVFAHTQEQYQAAIELGVKHIYYKNYVARNDASYIPVEGEILVGGYGALEHYRGGNIITDYSFNIANSEAVSFLHRNGALRVTLSHELNHKQINLLLKNYHDANDGYPNLEMIVYGYTPMMHTKHCILKGLNQCGECRKGNYTLDDGHGTFPLILANNCNMTVLNGKRLNLINDFMKIENINYFRLHFTIEDYEETKNIIRGFRDKLLGEDTLDFDKEKDTRGFFNREIL